MFNKNIVVIESLSCFGKSSVTVALPLLSVFGLSASVIPTVILSTHTGGYINPCKIDLEDFLEPTLNHWNNNNITFDGILTGYISSEKQIDVLVNKIDSIKKENTIFLCDPAFADNGKFYSGFSNDFAGKMLQLCKSADIITPNLTEACLLTDTAYKTEYDKEYIDSLLIKLYNLTDSTVVITGISFNDNEIISAVIDNNRISYISSKKISGNFHGTGDIFASCVIGCMLRGKDIQSSVDLAMNYVSQCLEITSQNSNDERIGILFENQLENLLKLLN